MFKTCSKCKKSKPETSEFFSIRNNIFRAACKECRKIESKKYYKENKEKLQERMKNPEVRSRANLSQKKYWEKQKQCPVNALKFYTRVRITIALKRKGFSKNTQTSEILGCNWNEFKAHIESKFQPSMTWDNREDWHLDHFIPLFVAETVEEVNRLNHFSNLRPLWAKDNLSKGSKIPEGFNISLFRNGLPLEECFSH